MIAGGEVPAYLTDSEQLHANVTTTKVGLYSQFTYLDHKLAAENAQCSMNTTRGSAMTRIEHPTHRLLICAKALSEGRAR